MSEQLVADYIQIIVGKSEQLSLGKLNNWGTLFRSVIQTELVHPCDTSNSPIESYPYGISVALSLQKACCPQLLKHFHLPLNSALFSTQVALFSRCVLATVRVLLSNDSLLLTAPQRLANASGQLVARCWLKRPKQSRSPAF